MPPAARCDPRTRILLRRGDRGRRALGPILVKRAARQDGDAPLFAAVLALATGSPAAIPGGLAGLARLARLVDLYALDPSIGAALEDYVLRRLTADTAGELLSALAAAPGAGAVGLGPAVDGGAAGPWSAAGAAGGPLARAEGMARGLAVRQFGRFSAGPGFLCAGEEALRRVLDDDALEVRQPGPARHGTAHGPERNGSALA